MDAIREKKKSRLHLTFTLYLRDKGISIEVDRVNSLRTCLLILGCIMGSTFQAEETLEVTLVASQDSRDELSEINQEIDKLTNQRNLYLAKATRLQNQGDRLQFENNNLIDARRAWQQAQIHREIATRIQEEIDILEKHKQKLLQESSKARTN